MSEEGFCEVHGEVYELGKGCPECNYDRECETTEELDFGDTPADYGYDGDGH